MDRRGPPVTVRRPGHAEVACPERVEVDFVCEDVRSSVQPGIAFVQQWMSTPNSATKRLHDRRRSHPEDSQPSGSATEARDHERR